MIINIKSWVVYRITAVLPRSKSPLDNPSRGQPISPITKCPDKTLLGQNHRSKPLGQLAPPVKNTRRTNSPPVNPGSPSTNLASGQNYNTYVLNRWCFVLREGLFVLYYDHSLFEPRGFWPDCGLTGGRRFDAGCPKGFCLVEGGLTEGFCLIGSFNPGFFVLQVIFIYLCLN